MDRLNRHGSEFQEDYLYKLSDHKPTKPQVNLTPRKSSQQSQNILHDRNFFGGTPGVSDYK
jgi:hypothetical protein